MKVDADGGVVGKGRDATMTSNYKKAASDGSSNSNIPPLQGRNVQLTHDDGKTMHEGMISSSSNNSITMTPDATDEWNHSKDQVDTYEDFYHPFDNNASIYEKDPPALKEVDDDDGSQSSSLIEDSPLELDFKTIKRLSRSLGWKLQVVLTKCDLVERNELCRRIRQGRDLVIRLDVQ